MATVTGLTADRMLAIEDASVVSGEIDVAGHLILTTYGGAEIDAGYSLVSVPDATDTVKGKVELATDAETATGTDATRAVTPAGLASVLDVFQPLDTDLTDIGALTPPDDNVLQRKASAWVSRTMDQLTTDLALVYADITVADAAIPQAKVATLVADLAAIVASVALKSPIASPTFTGTVTAPRVINTPVALTDAATIAVDAALGDQFTVTLGGNRTLGNPTNATHGQMVIFAIRQDGTGTRTLALGSNYRLGTDITTVVLSTAVNKTDYLGVRYNSADTKWDVIAFVKGY